MVRYIEFLLSSLFSGVALEVWSLADIVGRQMTLATLLMAFDAARGRHLQPLRPSMLERFSQRVFQGDCPFPKPLDFLGLSHVVALQGLLITVNETGEDALLGSSMIEEPDLIVSTALRVGL
ncbi:MAG: hypothetical protein NUW23_15495 [Firmicutes bacterium]|nr:hypothetical protein [Bacillota bacterium]